MYNTVLSSVTGRLDRRFLLNAFFPVGVALLALASVAVSSVSSVTSAANWWTGQTSFVQVLLAVASVAIVFILANALANNMLWITRVFEGYVIRPRSLVGPARKYRYSKWLKASDEREQDRHPEYREQIRNEYPLDPVAPADVLPTRLGNILRNGETYPFQRYGVDAVRVWPRLYHLIPDAMRQSMSDARASMESGLAISFLAGVFAPVAAILMLCTSASTIWTLLVLWGSIAISLVAFQGALPKAAIYRDHIRAAFDLHRLELLSQLQMPMPATADEERYLWANVVRFLIDGTPHVQRYVRPLGTSGQTS